MVFSPERAQTKCSFFPSNTIVGLVNIIAEDEILRRVNLWVKEQYQVPTFEVNPPLSGDLRICRNVLTKRGSD